MKTNPSAMTVNETVRCAVEGEPFGGGSSAGAEINTGVVALRAAVIPIVVVKASDSSSLSSASGGSSLEIHPETDRAQKPVSDFHARALSVGLKDSVPASTPVSFAFHHTGNFTAQVVCKAREIPDGFVSQGVPYISYDSSAWEIRTNTTALAIFFQGLGNPPTTSLSFSLAEGVTETKSLIFDPSMVGKRIFIGALADEEVDDDEFYLRGGIMVTVV